MQPQTLIKLLPFLAALASAAPVFGSAAGIEKRELSSEYCTVVPQTAATPATIDCKVPNLTDADLDALYAKLDPAHCTRLPSGIDCSLYADGAKVKRAADLNGDVVALPIVIGSGPALQKRQISTIPIPKDLVIGSVIDKGTVIGNVGGGAGNPVGVDVEVKYGYGGFKIGKPTDLEQLGTPAVLTGGGLTVPVIQPVIGP